VENGEGVVDARVAVNDARACFSHLVGCSQGRGSESEAE